MPPTTTNDASFDASGKVGMHGEIRNPNDIKTNALADKGPLQDYTKDNGPKLDINSNEKGPGLDINSFVLMDRVDSRSSHRSMGSFNSLKNDFFLESFISKPSDGVNEDAHDATSSARIPSPDSDTWQKSYDSNSNVRVPSPLRFETKRSIIAFPVSLPLSSIYIWESLMSGNGFGKNIFGNDKISKTSDGFDGNDEDPESDWYFILDSGLISHECSQRLF